MVQWSVRSRGMRLVVGSGRVEKVGKVGRWEVGGRSRVVRFGWERMVVRCRARAEGERVVVDLLSKAWARPGRRSGVRREVRRIFVDGESCTGGWSMD